MSVTTLPDSTKRLLRWGLMMIVIGVLLGWASGHLEQQEVVRYTPPRGEALTDPHYVLRQWMQRMGVRLNVSTTLGQLPLTSNTLVLTDGRWDVSRQHHAAVRDWVRRGGHLVLYANLLESDAHPEWLADLHVKAVPHHQILEAEKRGDKESESQSEPECFPVAEPPGLVESHPGWTWDNCQALESVLTGPQPPRWGLKDRLGWRVMRWPDGLGRITLIGHHPGSLDRSLLSDDQAAIVAAAWDLHAGQSVWLLLREDRPPLWQWLWLEAASVMLLGGLAVALALWRTMPRLGPLMAATSVGRRSLVEQVRGTAAFLLRRDPRALHAAQRQALLAAVTRCLPGSLIADPAHCWATVAARTGQDEAALHAALRGPEPTAPARAWGVALSCLELTRRRLLASVAADPSSLPSADDVPHA